MFFQHLTSDGLQASKKYTDPDFFKTYWVMRIKEQAEKALVHQREGDNYLDRLTYK